jgi:UDP-N-acetylglucosamine 2-epimerase
MRDVTERPEAIAAGAVRLVGANPQVIVREVTLLLDDPQEYGRRATPVFPYGDGNAAIRIADAIEAFA